MEGKKLKIDCGLCDATNVTEAMLEGYEGIKINCGAMMVTSEANRILMSRGVKVSTGSVISVPDGVRIIIKTGSFTLEPGTAPKEPTALIVTGSLTVKEGAGETLDGYAAVYVIGSVTCPRSLANKIQVTGNETIYPDGYVLVDDDVKLDKVSGLRWAGKRVFTEHAVMIDEGADLDALINSGTVFACGKAVVPEGLMEKAVGLLELTSDAQLVVIPKGVVYLNGRKTLTKALLRRGNRLWIDGSFTVDRREAELLPKLEYLHVEKRAVIPEELEESFSELAPECEDVFTYRGELISGQNYVNIDRATLSRYGFVTVLDCDAVKLDERLTDGEIRTGLAIVSCDAVLCGGEQINAVREVAEDVDYIGSDEGYEDDGEQGETNVVKIDCGTYSF